jgi:curved DNA-binding protein
MRYKDYYQVMGVPRTASQDDIKRAYRKLARKYHPDVSKEKDAEERFKELQEAHEVLKDPEKRAAYDQLGANWKQGQDFRPPPDWGQGLRVLARCARAGFGGFSDFFSELFGEGSPFGGADAQAPGRARRGLRGGRARTTSPASRSTSRTPTAAARARSSCARRR